MLVITLIIYIFLFNSNIYLCIEHYLVLIISLHIFEIFIWCSYVEDYVNPNENVTFTRYWSYLQSCKGQPVEEGNRLICYQSFFFHSFSIRRYNILGG